MSQVTLITTFLKLSFAQFSPRTKHEACIFIHYEDKEGDPKFTNCTVR